MNFFVVRKLFGFYVTYNGGSQSPFSQYGKPITFEVDGISYVAHCACHESMGSVRPVNPIHPAPTRVFP